MADVEQVQGNSGSEQQDLALTRGRRPWLWIAGGIVAVAIVAVITTMVMGKSVVYYKTPTEVLSLHDGQTVRMAGTLVAGSINADAGAGRTTFKMTDKKVTVTVVYLGSAATALSTASQPGTQIVAEGSMGTDSEFHATQLIAKCPSKFAAKTNGNS